MPLVNGVEYVGVLESQDDEESQCGSDKDGTNMHLFNSGRATRGTAVIALVLLVCGAFVMAIGRKPRAVATSEANDGLISMPGNGCPYSNCMWNCQFPAPATHTTSTTLGAYGNIGTYCAAKCKGLDKECGPR